MISSDLTTKIFINSLPKSGTHLLTNVINSFGFQNAATTRSNLQKVTRMLGFGPPRYLEYKSLNKHLGLYIFKLIKRRDDVDSVPIGVFSTVHVPVPILMNWVSFPKVGEYIVGHVPYSAQMDNVLNKHKYKHVLMIRDPRAVIVSFIHWVNRPNSTLQEEMRSLSPEDQLLLISIGGHSPISERPISGIIPAYKSILDWTNSENILVIKFEDLIGVKGGGTQETQFETIEKICTYLKVEVNDKQIVEISSIAYDTNAPTFRKGKIDAWKNEMSSHQKQLLNNTTSDLLYELGYFR